MSDAATVTIEPGAVSDAGATEGTPSATDAVANAMEKVKTKTAEAAEKLSGGETDAPNKSKGPQSEGEPADDAAAKRSESAKKGAETRRKNAEAKKEAEAAESAKEADKRVKDAETRADKAEKAAEKAAKASEATSQSAEKSVGESETQAPREWSKEAKADWDATPQTVRDQVTRMQGEFEQGFAKHKEGAEKYKTIERFEPLAERHNTTMERVLEDYAQLDQAMRTNPMQTIATIAQRHNVNLTEMAENILGQQTSETYKTMETNLNKAVNHIRKLEGMLEKHQRKELDANQSYIDKLRLENDDFDELEPDIMFMLQNHTGLGNSPKERLDNALIRARRLAGKEAPPPKESPASAETEAAERAKSAETAEATLSAGSQSGTYVKTEKPAESAEEAVKRAMRKRRGR